MAAATEAGGMTAATNLKSLEALDKDGFTVSALARQYESMKPTYPSYSFGTGTRDTGKLAALRNSPGPIYKVKGSTGTALHKWKFGTAAQRPNYKAEVPISSTDAMDITPDSQKVKYKYKHPVPFGTAARDHMKLANIMKANPEAFFGYASPGPANYYGDFKVLKERGETFPFGLRTQLQGKSQTGTIVGPGLYPHPAAIGPQAESQKLTLPGWVMGKDERFRMGNDDETVLETFIPPSSMGRQVKSKKKSNPSFGFGTATRDNRARSAVVFDAPKGQPGGAGAGQSMRSTRLPHPVLPVRRTTIVHGPPPPTYPRG